MALSEQDLAVRDQAVWSTEAGMIAEGKAGEVFLQKTGQKPKPDLSDNEAVQMGLIMQEPIMKAAANRWHWEFKDADYALRHPKHNWLASHFDYISADGKTLYEVKNLGIHQRNKYGESGEELITPRYRAQCLHEQIVHEGVENIILVVLFGGQELCHFPQNFTQLEAEAHIRAMAEFWAQVQTKTFNADTMSDAIKDVYTVDDGQAMVANAALETACQQLAAIKSKLKEYEEAEEGLKQMIQQAMGAKATLKSFTGDVLATWKTSKASRRFSADLLKQTLPETYEKFMVEQPGSRRFLIK